MQFSDTPVNSIKSKYGRNVIYFFPFPISSSLEFISDNSPKELNMMIQYNLHTTMKVNSFKTPLNRSNQRRMMFESNYSLKVVLKIQRRYLSSPNMQINLSSISSEKSHQSLVRFMFNNSTVWPNTVMQTRILLTPSGLLQLCRYIRVHIVGKYYALLYVYISRTCRILSPQKYCTAQ